MSRSLVLLGVVFILAWGFCHSQFGGAKDDTFWSAYVEKIHLLKSAGPGPRLVLVGGSNCAFSINSEIFAKDLPLTPVNLGLGIGLPIGVWWRVLERWGKHGDTVVLSLEVPYYSGHRVHGELFSLGQIAILDPGVLPVFWDSLSTETFDNGLTVAGRLMHGALGMFRGGETPTHDFMRRSHFNQYGDLVIPEGLDVKFTADTKVYPSSIPKALAGVKDIVKTVHSLKHKQMRFVFALPPAIAGYRAHFEAISEALRNLGQTVLLHPDASIYPLEAFLDGIYHLKEPYRSMHTKKIAQALQASVYRDVSNQ